MKGETISVIINNYNYDKYLEQAIQSVLTQSVLPHEIIVVDDGSTDNSPAILDRYKSQVKVVSKSNGGQASAFNAGFEVATGEWIWFVDADDFLVRDAIKIVTECISPGLSKIHSPLLVVEGDKPTDRLHPWSELSTGDVVKDIVNCGAYRWPPTTGNIFHRAMMEACMPIPETEYKLCADFYLCSFAPFHGKMSQTRQPIAYYRIHNNNRFYRFTFEPARQNAMGKIYLLVAERTEFLVRKYTKFKDWVFPYERRTLEAIVVAKRYGHLETPADLSGLHLHKRWLESVDIKKASVKGKAVAITYWTVLNFSPLFVTTLLLKRGMSKRKLVEARSN